MSRGWGYPSPPAGPFLFLGLWEGSDPEALVLTQQEAGPPQSTGEAGCRGPGARVGHSGVHRQRGWG